MDRKTTHIPTTYTRFTWRLPKCYFHPRGIVARGVVIEGGLAVRSFWTHRFRRSAICMCSPGTVKTLQETHNRSPEVRALYIHTPPIRTQIPTWLPPPPPLPMPPHSHISREIIAGASALLKHTLYYTYLYNIIIYITYVRTLYTTNKQWGKRAVISALPPPPPPVSSVAAVYQWRALFTAGL